MRIMLDTNILISIVIFNSDKLKKMLMNICEKHTLVLSPYIIQELEKVSERKFPNRKKDMMEFIYNLPCEIAFVPLETINNKILNIRDKKDIPVLYSAIISDVDILITGDKDFNDINIKRPEILTPSEFLNKYY